VFSACSTASGRIGRCRSRAPEAAKTPLAIAGATTVVAGSPRQGKCAAEREFASERRPRAGRPRPRNRRRIGIRQSGGDPIVDHGACIGFVDLLGAEPVARRVTAAAMTEAFGQVGAAIPFCALGRVGLVAAASEKQNLPAFLQGADRERKGYGVRQRRRIAVHPSGYGTPRSIRRRRGADPLRPSRPESCSPPAARSARLPAATPAQGIRASQEHLPR
jgi:hypothetical protein